MSWNPNKPKAYAPHHKPRNVKLTRLSYKQRLQDCPVTWQPLSYVSESEKIARLAALMALVRS